MKHVRHHVQRQRHRGQAVFMPVAVAVPVGTRCRFKVQLIHAPPSLGATSFGVATSSVGLEGISSIGNQRNT